MQSVPNNSEQIFLIISIKFEYLITNIKTITPKRDKAFRGDLFCCRVLLSVQSEISFDLHSALFDNGL